MFTPVKNQKFGYQVFIGLGFIFGATAGFLFLTGEASKWSSSFNSLRFILQLILAGILAAGVLSFLKGNVIRILSLFLIVPVLIGSSFFLFEIFRLGSSIEQGLSHSDAVLAELRVVKFLTAFLSLALLLAIVSGVARLIGKDPENPPSELNL